MPMLKQPKYIVNERGKKIAVQLDLKTYQQLIEAYEDFCDNRTLDRVKPLTDAEIARGDYLDWNDVVALRLRKRRSSKNGRGK